jgi:hypothetical protein
MAHRRHGSMPSIALWVLVAIGDLVIIIVNAGMAALIALGGLVTAGIAGFFASLFRRSRARGTAGEPAPAAVPVEPEP